MRWRRFPSSAGAAARSPGYWGCWCWSRSASDCGGSLFATTAPRPGRSRRRSPSRPSRCQRSAPRLGCARTILSMRFEGTVLITGASAGIGEACARAFAAAGARLVLTARRLERLQALAEELGAAHGTQAHLLELDVRDRDAVLGTLGALPEPWEAVEVLVNNAGLGRGLDRLSEGDPDGWDEMVDTNVKGLLYATRAVTPGMVR